MPLKKQQLPMFDANGRPVRLQPKITYKLRVKNGYILALLPDQHQQRLPNLMRVHRETRALNRNQHQH